LEIAINNNRLVELPGIGIKTQQHIARDLKLKYDRFGKLRYDQALLRADGLRKRLIRNDVIDVSIVGDPRAIRFI